MIDDEIMTFTYFLFLLLFFPVFQILREERPVLLTDVVKVLGWWLSLLL